MHRHVSSASAKVGKGLPLNSEVRICKHERHLLLESCGAHHQLQKWRGTGVQQAQHLQRIAQIVAAGRAQLRMRGHASAEAPRQLPQILRQLSGRGVGVTHCGAFPPLRCPAKPLRHCVEAA